MRLLLIGGTRFVGLAIAREALARGHEVTIFHRGKTVPVGLEGAQFLSGDRDADTSALTGGEDAQAGWDATIDVCAYRPQQVDRLFAALGPRGGRHVFISTVSVYDPAIPSGCDESAPLADTSVLDDLDTETCDITGETYGALKVLCERQVCEHYENPLIIRPTYVIGPDDYTMRFPAWVERIAAGGVVQAPLPRENPFQYVDARDQAKFIVSLLEAGTTGTFHTPAPTVTFEEMLQSIAAAVGAADTNVEFDWVSATEEDAARFPLWGGNEPVGMMAMDSTAAVSAGLKFRPLAESARDTYVWLQHRG